MYIVDIRTKSTNASWEGNSFDNLHDALELYLEYVRRQAGGEFRDAEENPVIYLEYYYGE